MSPQRDDAGIGSLVPHDFLDVLHHLDFVPRIAPDVEARSDHRAEHGNIAIHVFHEAFPKPGPERGGG